MQPLMSLMTLMKRALSKMAHKRGYAFTEIDALFEWQRPGYSPQPNRRQTDQYLTESNPRLLELIDRYSRCDSRVTTAELWQGNHMDGDLLRFPRGDNAYVWQLRGTNMHILGYALTAYYLASRDSEGLFDCVVEDDCFGNFVFTIAGRTVSRDILDSLIELLFLEKHLGLSRMPAATMLDIGAGYGRLAHRACEIFPNIANYLCVDAIPQSTFISEFYLRFRGSRARVVPLDEIESVLTHTRPDIAVNIHSFSECRHEAIDWWLSLLERTGVRYVMIVPNDARHDGGRNLVTNDGRDFSSIVERHGYKLIAREPKYADPVVQQFGINPTHHYLFELG